MERSPGPGGQPTKLELSSAAFRHPRPEVREPPAGQSMHVGASLRRHTGLAAMVALVMLLAGLAYLHFRYANSFYAESLVYVSPSYPETLPEPLTIQHEVDRPYDPFIEQQVHTITRRDILLSALRHLPRNIYGAGSEQEIVDRLAANLEVERITNTFQVRIGLRTGDGAHVASIVNAVTTAYLDVAHNEEFFGRDTRLKGLKTQRDELARDVIDKQKRQAELENGLGVASISALAVNPYNDRLVRLHNDLVAAREKREEAEDQLDTVRGEGSPALAAEAADMVASDSGLNGLKQTLNTRRGELVAGMAGMTEQNPARHQAELELADIDATLARMTRDVRGEAAQRLAQRYRTQAARARLYEGQVAGQIHSVEREAAVATPRFQEAQGLVTAIDHDSTRLHLIEDRIGNLELESSSPGSVHLFSAAQRPAKGETGKEHTLLLMLFPFCLAAGIASAVARDSFDPLVYSPEDVERGVGLPPVGILFDRDEVSADLESEYAFRMGATLDHARRTAGLKTFAFTAVRSEGGTSTVVALLASQMAVLGNRVLVLDAADHRQPIAYLPPEQDPTGSPEARTLHPELGLQLNSRGRLLPSVHTVTEAFRRSFGEYDCLLLDCAPLLMSAETEYHARQADATLLIATSGETQKADLLRAARLLERLRVPGLAIVLNRLRIDRADRALQSDLRAYERYGRKLPVFYPATLGGERDEESGGADTSTESGPHSRPDGEA